jgi:dihydrofolate synthase/folylpolyglutamate synthase
MPSSSTDAARDRALAFLLGRIDYERMPVVPYGEQAYRLARMRELLDRLGNPAADVPIVHVAGTKGKGSTSAAIAAVLTAAGFRTGLFTSPHLDCLEERIRLDGLQCTAEELVALVDRVRPSAEAMDAVLTDAEGRPAGPTYFELTTAMALLHFADCGANAAVLEVGMGGRLDSTNVCRPAVAVLTSISLDHTRQLGDTLTAIAREKAGIIKPGVPVVSGVIRDEPRRVIEQTCREQGCTLSQRGRDFQVDYTPPRHLEESSGRGRADFRYFGPAQPHEFLGLELGLLGRHQADNAGVALAALAELRRQGWIVPETAVRQGLAEVRSPARVEVIARHPLVIIDAAHNVASVAALVETLDESFSARPRTLVFATTREKDVEGMLRLLLPRFDRAILTRYLGNPRYVPPEELAAVARSLGDYRVQTLPHPAAVYEELVNGAAEQGLICVTGSFFIAAEMRTLPAGRPLA